MKLSGCNSRNFSGHKPFFINFQRNFFIFFNENITSTSFSQELQSFGIPCLPLGYSVAWETGSGSPWNLKEYLKRGLDSKYLKVEEFFGVLDGKYPLGCIRGLWFDGTLGLDRFFWRWPDGWYRHHGGIGGCRDGRSDPFDFCFFFLI